MYEKHLRLYFLTARVYCCNCLQHNSEECVCSVVEELDGSLLLPTHISLGFFSASKIICTMFREAIQYPFYELLE